MVVSPDYADSTKFADTWLPAQPGTDGALAMAMGHVILKEFLVERPTLFFADYLSRFTDMPFLVTLEERDGSHVPAKFLTAADLGDTGEGAEWKTVLIDESTGEPVVPNGSLGFRHTESGKGRWNLDLADVTPALTLLGDGAAEVLLPRFDSPDGAGTVLRRGVPVRRVARQARDNGVRPRARAVRRGASPECPASGRRVRRPVAAVHPGLAGAADLRTRPTRRSPWPGRWRATPRSPAAAR